MRKLQIKLAVFVLCFSTLMNANTPHTHVEATASIIIKNNKITIALSIPGESIVGFEHSPTTDDEVTQIQDATKQLETHSLFNFYEVSGILKKQTNLQPIETSVNVDSPVQKQALNHDDHHHHNHDKHHSETKHKKQESHSNFDIKLSYFFNDASKIELIEASLLKLLPSLNKVNTIIITNTNQNEFILTKNSTTVKLN